MRPEAGGPPGGKAGAGPGPAPLAAPPGELAWWGQVRVALAASRRGGTVGDIGRAGEAEEQAAASVSLDGEFDDLLKLKCADVRAVAARRVRQRKVIILA